MCDSLTQKLSQSLDPQNWVLQGQGSMLPQEYLKNSRTVQCRGHSMYWGINLVGDKLGCEGGAEACNVTDMGEHAAQH